VRKIGAVQKKLAGKLSTEKQKFTVGWKKRRKPTDRRPPGWQGGIPYHLDKGTRKILLHRRTRGVTKERNDPKKTTQEGRWQGDETHQKAVLKTKSGCGTEGECRGTQTRQRNETYSAPALGKKTLLLVASCGEERNRPTEKIDRGESRT